VLGVCSAPIGSWRGGVLFRSADFIGNTAAEVGPELEGFLYSAMGLPKIFFRTIRDEFEPKSRSNPKKPPGRAARPGNYQHGGGVSPHPPRQRSVGPRPVNSPNLRPAMLFPLPGLLSRAPQNSKPEKRPFKASAGGGPARCQLAKPSPKIGNSPLVL